MDKNRVTFTHDSKDTGAKEFAQAVQQTLVQQPDYGGIGGHGKESHHGHGEHSQVSIKSGDTVVTFRETNSSKDGKK